MRVDRLVGMRVHVRRARRTDLASLEAFVGRPLRTGTRRELRRIVADLRAEVYVVEGDGGSLVGLLSLGYVRSLARGGFSAVVDDLRALGDAAQVVREGLVDLAETRARHRGCGRIVAWLDEADPEVASLRAALRDRGWAGGELLMRPLDAGLGVACGRAADRLREPGDQR